MEVETGESFLFCSSFVSRIEWKEKKNKKRNPKSLLDFWLACENSNFNGLIRNSTLLSWSPNLILSADGFRISKSGASFAQNVSAHAQNRVVLISFELLFIFSFILFTFLNDELQFPIFSAHPISLFLYFFHSPPLSFYFSSFSFFFWITMPSSDVIIYSSAAAAFVFTVVFAMPLFFRKNKFPVEGRVSHSDRWKRFNIV